MTGSDGRRCEGEGGGPEPVDESPTLFLPVQSGQRGEAVEVEEGEGVVLYVEKACTKERDARRRLVVLDFGRGALDDAQ